MTQPPRSCKTARVPSRPILGLLILLVSAGFLSTIALAQDRAIDLDSPATVFAHPWPETRTELQAGHFLNDSLPTEPIDNSHFLPAGPSVGMGARITGALTLAETILTVRAIGAGAPEQVVFPETVLTLTLQGDRLLPALDDTDRLIEAQSGPVPIIGIGRAWTEPEDGGWSRALLPVSLITGAEGSVRNGLLSFLFQESGATTSGFLQFAQETTLSDEAGIEADLLGQVDLSFTAVQWPGAQLALIEFMTGLAKAPTYRDWPIDLPDSVSAAALLMAGEVLLAPCRTRRGSYPFCRQMRHAVGPLSQPLLAFPATAHMAQRFWRGVPDAPVQHYLPELSAIEGWDMLRIRHLLDHRSGVAFPKDQADRLIQQSPAALLEVVGATATLPRPPGEDRIPNALNPVLLSIALDRIARSRLGQDRGLLWLLQDRFLDGIGLPAPITRVHAYDDPKDAVPDLGRGFFPTTDEVARLLLALQDTRDPETRSALARAFVQEAFDTPLDPDAHRLGFGRAQIADCPTPAPLARAPSGSTVMVATRDLAGFFLTDDASRAGWATFLDSAAGEADLCG